MLIARKRVWNWGLTILSLLLFAVGAALHFDVPLRIEVAMVDRRYGNGDMSMDTALALIGKDVGTRELLNMLHGQNIWYLSDSVITGALASNMMLNDPDRIARDGLIGYMCYGSNESVAVDCAMDLSRYDNVPGVRESLLESVVRLKRPLVTPCLMAAVRAKFGRAGVPYLIASLYTNPEYSYQSEAELYALTGRVPGTPYITGGVPGTPYITHSYNCVWCPEWH